MLAHYCCHTVQHPQCIYRTSDDEDEHEEEYDDEMAYGCNYIDIGEQLHGDRTYEIVWKIGYARFTSSVQLASFPK